MFGKNVANYHKKRKMMKKISLVILTYNSENDIYNCLDSVYQHNDIGDGLEVIIVDNNSTNYAEMHDNIRSLYPDVKIIANNRNGGYGQGNNVGIRATSSPIVAIMNPDVRLVMPTFRLIYDTLQKQDIIMCGGKQYINEGKEGTSYFCDYHCHPLYQSIMYSHYRRHDIFKPKYMWLSGAFFAIKKDYFEKIGLFDETIFMYGEEYDIHMRLQKLLPTKTVQYIKELKYIHLIEDRIYTKDSYIKPYTSIYHVCKKHNLSIEKVFENLIWVCRIQFAMAYILRLLNRPYDPKAHDKINMFKDLFKHILQTNQ